MNLNDSVVLNYFRKTSIRIVGLHILVIKWYIVRSKYCKDIAQGKNVGEISRLQALCSQLVCDARLPAQTLPPPRIMK